MTPSLPIVSYINPLVWKFQNLCEWHSLSPELVDSWSEGAYQLTLELYFRYECCMQVLLPLSSYGYKRHRVGAIYILGLY